MTEARGDRFPGDAAAGDKKLMVLFCQEIDLHFMGDDGSVGKYHAFCVHLSKRFVHVLGFDGESVGLAHVVAFRAAELHLLLLERTPVRQCFEVLVSKFFVVLAVPLALEYFNLVGGAVDRDAFA